MDHPPKTEYGYLLELYKHLSLFEPFTSTFTFLNENERREIMLTIGVLQRKLQTVMPRVQDREAQNDSITRFSYKEY